jgi:hypothetical protein
LGKTGRNLVVPFPGARVSLWAAQRGLIFGSVETQRLAAQIVEELYRAEEDIEAVEAALQPHPTGADLETFIGGRMGRKEAQNVVRHLLTGCPKCKQVTRKLFADQPPQLAEIPAGRPLRRIK